MYTSGYVLFVLYICEKNLMSFTTKDNKIDSYKKRTQLIGYQVITITVLRLKGWL